MHTYTTQHKLKKTEDMDIYRVEVIFFPDSALVRNL